MKEYVCFPLFQTLESYLNLGLNHKSRTFSHLKVTKFSSVTISHRDFRLANDAGLALWHNFYRLVSGGRSVLAVCDYLPAASAIIR